MRGIHFNESPWKEDSFKAKVEGLAAGTGAVLVSAEVGAAALSAKSCLSLRLKIHS